jgi:hypothetical protein
VPWQSRRAIIEWTGRRCASRREATGVQFWSVNSRVVPAPLDSSRSHLAIVACVPRNAAPLKPAPLI